MPSFEELHIQPVIARVLDQRGWTPETPASREVAPTAARGHNLVALAPPIPVYAAPAVAGMLSRVERGKLALVLVPPVQLEDWGALISELAQDASLSIQVGRGPSRAMRRLRGESLDVLVTTLETALQLVARSALRMETVGALLLAWPESLSDDDSVMPLMQDLPREAQRIVYTAEPARVPAWVDRYARKALTVGADRLDPGPLGPVRTVTTAWNRRVQALADVIEVVDPASLVVWTADRGYHGSIRRLIAGNQSDIQLVVDDAPPADTIIAFDLPTRDRLEQLLGAGEVILLVPTGTEAYVARIAAPRRPLQLPGPLDAARSSESLQRQEIQSIIETGQGSRALLTLAPLFERYDAPSVAAALYQLWRGSAHPAAAPPSPAPHASETAKVFVGAGKKDGVTANDLVAVLTKELRFDRTQIGRIELRDGYSLVELPAQEAERLAGQLNGMTIRRRRVTARVDRGPTRPGRGDGDARSRPTRKTNSR
ncbi:MAG TPA: DbpA RNA binding domain-containing protein [Gemmatimonadales bacterium]|nr:DbpA RNA binding domain-containing protein [Gemmatimonadales bacterium]